MSFRGEGHVQGLGFRVYNSGILVPGPRFRVWGLGFGVWGSGLLIVGSYLRLIDSCITQLKAQGPSRTCNLSNDEEEGVWD